jgi:hypothetical protein
VTSVALILTSRASAGELLIEVFIPGLEKGSAVLYDEIGHVGQLVRVEVGRAGQSNWLEPELGKKVIAASMDMRRLVSFVTEKEEAVRSDAENGRHLLKPLWKYRLGELRMRSRPEITNPF